MSKLNCINCGHPLLDNDLVKEAYNCNNTASWAKMQLKIIADMLEDRGLEYFAKEARRIMDGINLITLEGV